MSSRYEPWAGRPVSRDDLGRFAGNAASHAARLIADAAVPGRSVSRMFREGARPEGFEHLAGRASYLADIPSEKSLGRDRTDDEHEELELIEAAVKRYYDSIGLRGENHPEDYRRRFAGEDIRYDPYGEVIAGRDVRPTTGASARGYLPIGDNPDGGKLWYNPISPTNRYNKAGRWIDGFVYNDDGYAVGSGLRDAMNLGIARSKKEKMGRGDRRVAEFERDRFGNPFDREFRIGRGEWQAGQFGGRGSLEQDFTSLTKLSNPMLNKRLRQSKGAKKRARTWIEKLNLKMERGGAS
jgi:hypothetical protein